MFDKLFSLPGIRVLRPLYEKYKAAFLYLFFGALTTAVSVLSFAFFDRVVCVPVLLSNVLSWILAVSFAYVTNRKWVFASRSTGFAIVKEAFSFVAARVTTLLIEEAILSVFVLHLGFDSLGIKLCAQVVVLILNYIFSKLLVFRNK